MIKGWIYSGDQITTLSYGKIAKELICVIGTVCDVYTWNGDVYERNALRIAKSKADKLVLHEPLENKRFKVSFADREELWCVFCKDVDEINSVVSDEIKGHIEREDYMFNIKVEEV